MPIRPLSKELQEIAEKQLNEVPTRVQADLEHIREWISQQPHLKARTDDQWLIAFLRASKFSLQRTKEKIDLFYTMKSLDKSNRDPFSPEIQVILSQGVACMLPKLSHPTAPRILLSRGCNFDVEKSKLLDYFKVTQMGIEISMMEDDNFVIVGVASMHDVKNFPYAVLSQATPEFVKRIISYSKDVYPLRVKAFEFFNAPPAFGVLYNIFKLLSPEKFRRRLFLHTHDDIKEVHNIKNSILPREYGGDEVSCDELCAQFKAKYESYRDWFLEDAQYGVDESKRPAKLQNKDVPFGTDGSFRTIQLD